MNKKKSSWLSYIAPYLIILLIILGVSFLFGNNKSSKWNYTAGDIVSGFTFFSLSLASEAIFGIIS